MGFWDSPHFNRNGLLPLNENLGLQWLSPATFFQLILLKKERERERAHIPLWVSVRLLELWGID
jgi:hypothetical protein